MSQLSLFAETSTRPRRLAEPIARQAYIRDSCRYWLKRAWGAGGHICWVMCNPSDADASKDDPTMLRVMEFSASWGFGSCTVINPIPFVSSTPAAAIAWARRAMQVASCAADRSPERDEWLSNIYHCERQMREAQAHVAAWGNNLPQEIWRAWLQEVAEAADGGCGGGMREDDGPPIEWLCVGTTQSGAPKHPLARGKHRVPAGAQPIGWSQ